MVDARTIHSFATLTQRAVAARLGLVAAMIGALLFYGVLTGGLWPSLEGVLGDFQQVFPEAFLRFSGASAINTPAGWMNAEMVSTVAPGIVIAVAVMSGVRATAGEEHNKTLGMVLSTPVPRLMFILSKLSAMAVHVVITVAGLGVSIGIGSMIGGLDLEPAHIVATTIHTALLGLVFGTFAMLIAVTTGSSRAANAGTAVAAIAAFVAATFLPLSSSLKAGEKLSPWYYFSGHDPLANGMNSGHILVLSSIFIVLAIACVAVFERRDLRG